MAKGKIGLKVPTQNELLKKYGSMIKLASETQETGLWLPSTFFALNYTFGGGIPFGKILEVAGEESSGKSLIAYNFAYACQQLGGAVIWVDAEQSWMNSWAKANGVPVIYTKEVHRHQKMDFGLEIDRGDPEHCLEGTEGCEIVKEVVPDESDFVVIKRRYSGFYQTDLEIILKGLQKNTLILTGVDTNVCVYSTALEAQFRNLRTIALSDCTAGTNEAIHLAFLENIETFLGEVMTLAELKEYFG